MKRAIWPLYRAARLAWLRWLEREMCVYHPARMEVRLEILELEAAP